MFWIPIICATEEIVRPYASSLSRGMSTFIDFSLPPNTFAEATPSICSSLDSIVSSASDLSSSGVLFPLSASVMIGIIDGSSFIVIGESASSGRKFRTRSILSLTSPPAASRFVPKLNSRMTREIPPIERDCIFLSPETPESELSSVDVRFCSTSSGPAPS